MADNTQVASGTGDTVRDKDRAGVKTQIVGLDLGIGTGTESLMEGVMPTKVAGLTLTTGTITTTTSTVTATIDIPNAGTVTVVIAGTYAGVNVSFEASVDGTTWVAVMGQRVDAYVTETNSGVLAANTTRAWDFPLPGFTQFRVRATAWTSGTANIGIAPAVNPFEISPTVALAGVGNSAQTGVAASATSVTLLAANPARRGATIHNDATSATLYVRLNASAAANASGGYTTVMPPGAYYEVPANYSGAITGIWASAAGFANMTELT
jgi:hypothetical protein